MTGCTLDTDVVIAALDRTDAHHKMTSRLFARWTEGAIPLSISSINYAETLVRPAADSKTLELAVDAISALGIEVVMPNAVVARDAARLRGLGVSLADGFAIATAQSLGSSVASFDKRVQRAATELGLEIVSA